MSIAESIGVRTTALQRLVQSVTVITTPPAGVHIGTQVFAVVGTSDHTATALSATPRFAVRRSGNIEEAPTDGVGYLRGFRCPGLN